VPKQIVWLAVENQIQQQPSYRYNTKNPNNSYKKATKLNVI